MIILYDLQSRNIFNTWTQRFFYDIQRLARKGDFVVTYICSDCEWIVPGTWVEDE